MKKYVLEIEYDDTKEEILSIKEYIEGDTIRYFLDDVCINEFIGDEEVIKLLTDDTFGES